MNKKQMLQAMMARGMMPDSRADEPGAFREFGASELYCPKCKQAMPVREKLLLVLPSGELTDYVCQNCGTSLGTKS